RRAVQHAGPVTGERSALGAGLLRRLRREPYGVVPVVRDGAHAQKAVRPRGDPTPVGPSQPGWALHKAYVGQVPPLPSSLVPAVTSCSAQAGARYTVFGPSTSGSRPARAYNPPTYGEEALVPPSTVQPTGWWLAGA